MMKLPLVFVALCVAGDLSAQSQQVVVDAVTSPATVSKTTTAITKESDASGEIAKALNSAKAANADLLKRQEATLQALDELQKEADQIRIYSKRG